MTARHDKAIEIDQRREDMGLPKLTEGRTEAAAVDQAIADVEKALRWMAEYRMTGTEQTLHIDFQGKAIEVLPALRVLADAVEHWQREYIEACRSLTKRVHQGAEAVRRAEAAEAENVRLARQAADLKADLILYGRHGTFCAHSTGGMCDCGLATALGESKEEE